MAISTQVFGVHSVRTDILYSNKCEEVTKGEQ